MDDYRNTRYCPQFGDISKKKSELKEKLDEKHQVKDLYTLISPNEGTSTYKTEFMKIYNNKCCYCGVQLPIISKTLFEIDHFRNKKHPIFANEAEAGNIENLVLSCRKCNRSKSEFVIDDGDYNRLCPDDGSITKSFVRDENYYIQISESGISDSKIQEFYHKLKLNDEVRRLDYLLMSVRGLKNRTDDKPGIQIVLGKIADILQEKRSTFY